MPDERPTKMPQTRNGQLDKNKTDSQDEYTRPRKKTENTANVIKKAEKDFALDLPLLVDERARDIKILNVITAIEKQQLENTFYPYRPHRLHLSTRFGLLFYNDKIVIPENMRTTIIAMLHQGHTPAAKVDGLAEAFWWPGMHREIQEKAETCPSSRAEVGMLLHKSHQRRKII